MEFTKGMKVKLPFGETGKIVEVKDLIWGFKYAVKIITGVFNNPKEIVDFKAEQLEAL